MRGTENSLKKSHKKNFYSPESKRAYYEEWLQSGLAINAFCKSKAIGESAFRRWKKGYEAVKAKHFLPLTQAPVISKRQTASPSSMVVRVECGKQTVLQVQLGDHALVSLIKELSNAATIIR